MLRPASAIQWAGAGALIVATATRASAQDPPYNGRTAEPAMSGPFQMVYNAGVSYVPKLGPLQLTGSKMAPVSLPSASETWTVMGMSMLWGGGLGVRPYGTQYGFDFGFGMWGSAPHSMSAEGYGFKRAFTSRMRFLLPGIGIGWHSTGVILGGQIVPDIQWSALVYDPAPWASGAPALKWSGFFFDVNADLQACVEYNLQGTFPRNSAVCFVAQPVIYGTGSLFNGLTLGIRGTLI